jgi:hypothetical protein
MFEDHSALNRATKELQSRTRAFDSEAVVSSRVVAINILKYLCLLKALTTLALLIPKFTTKTEKPLGGNKRKTKSSPANLALIGDHALIP